MTLSLKKTLKTLVPIVLGIFLVWYLYTSTTEAQRAQILLHIKTADPVWIVLSVFIGMLSHISRAIRWNYLLAPLGHSPRVINNVLIILTAYLANLGVPRSGEFLRATALDTYAQVPFEKGFGTIVTERVVDVLMLLLIVLAALLFQTDLIMGFLRQSGVGILGSLGLLLIGILGLFFAIRSIRKSGSGLAQKIKRFLSNMMEGILSIGKMRNKWAFVAHTLFIWAAYFAMFWVVKFTVPGTAGATTGAMLIAFVGGALAMMTTNGGFLAYPVAVGKSLEIFGIGAVAGTAFGWIMWVAQTLMIIIFGAISFLILPLLNKDRK